MPKYSHSRRACGALVAMLCPILSFFAGVAGADARVARATGGAIEYSDRLAPSAGVSLDLPSERAAVTSARMQGRWLARSEDGSMTVLELRPGGGFVFDHQAQATPERAYMCGAWSLDGGELSLLARTLKTRAATGEVQLSEGEHRSSFTVLAARTDVLILRSDGETLTFHRRGA
jgi:hypothetical protein